MASKLRVGVLGGGQLGLMLAESANKLGVQTIVLDPTTACPAAQAATKHILGDFKDPEQIKKLAAESDVITVEIEHVNADALIEIQSANPAVRIQPAPQTIKLIQDKYNQKVHLRKHGIAVVDFISCDGVEDVKKAGEMFGYPLMLKSRLLAYDGRGNAVVKSESDIEAALKSLVSPCIYAEKWAPYVKELAVMVVRALDGSVVSYPVVETIQKNNICHVTVAPAHVGAGVQEQTQRLAEAAIATFEGAGIFGVELFLLDDGSVVLNEVAPRPHNSGHYTIEGCYTSQFENHLRAVVGLPLGATGLSVGAAGMLNIVGEANGEEGKQQSDAIIQQALSVGGATVHWYGKHETRKGRKMGHITVVAPSVPALHRAMQKLGVEGHDEAFGAAGAQVGIIMGSDSDLPTMKAAAEVLEEFGVPFELTVVSAHRTPQRMVHYANSAHKRGIRVIIAAAGGAAHLPGMVAAMTPLPVIGVPVPLKYLDGQDSLLSIVQMPRGVPVATVAIGNSTNAGLLAVRMLGSFDPVLLDKMLNYQKAMEDTVMAKVEVLDKVGWKDYKVQH
eukprot:Colp12_sorted_trinity150504_noHs@11185